MKFGGRVSRFISFSCSSFRAKRNGFSLVELMVVVGIIGLLAAIAVPQFAKFQAKARQNEARTILGAIFTGEKAFLAEWNVYSHSMKVIGVGVSGAKTRYNGQVGAGDAICGGLYAVGAPNSAALETVMDASPLATYDAGLTGPLSPAASLCDNDVKTFKASVYGDPNNDIASPTSNVDQWSINNNKTYVHELNGIL